MFSVCILDCVLCPGGGGHLFSITVVCCFFLYLLINASFELGFSCLKGSHLFPFITPQFESRVDFMLKKHEYKLMTVFTIQQCNTRQKQSLGISNHQ